MWGWELEYEKVSNARHLAQECKSRLLVSLEAISCIVQIKLEP